MRKLIGVLGVIKLLLVFLESQVLKCLKVFRKRFLFNGKTGKIVYSRKEMNELEASGPQHSSSNSAFLGRTK